MTATTSTEAPSGAQQDKAGAKAIGTLLTGAEDTAAHQPEQKKSSTKWLRPFLKPVMPSFREVAVVSFFVNLAALATPVFVMQVYDRVVFHKGMSTLLGLAIGMAFMLTFDFILRQARSRIMQTVALRMEAQVARSLFAKVNALPLKILEGRPAEFWHLLFRDVDVVRNTLSGPSAVLVVDVPFSILFMAVIFILAPPLAWVLVVALVIFLTLAILSGRAVQSAADAEKESTIGRDGLLAEVLRGRATVKALSLGDAIRPHWEGKVAGQVERSIHRGGRTDMFSNLAMVMTIGTSVGMTVVGALAIMEQNLTIGGLIAANMMAGRLLSPLGQLVGAWRSYAAFGQSVKRLGEAFSLPEDREETLAAHPRPRGEVAAEEVVVSYPRASKPALKGVTCGFLPGGMTAILGTNGSGKSTLLKTLQGLYAPDSGRVLIDGADITQFSRPEMARWIGHLPQDTILFAGTIRDNIIMGADNASDGDVLKAAKRAGVHELIVDLPDGYGTQVGEAGGRMSGGMRQRIALARALVGDPPILMLDEPSASLDRAAEESLCQRLAELAQTRTVIVVTHSPTMLQQCQTVVLMDRGKVVAAGPAKTILPQLMGRARAGGAGAAPQPARPSTPAPVPAPAPSPAPQATLTPNTTSGQPQDSSLGSFLANSSPESFAGSAPTPMPGAGGMGQSGMQPSAPPPQPAAKPASDFDKPTDPKTRAPGGGFMPAAVYAGAARMGGVMSWGPQVTPVEKVDPSAEAKEGKSAASEDEKAGS